jgi:hypothetical protein
MTVTRDNDRDPRDWGSMPIVSADMDSVGPDSKLTLVPQGLKKYVCRLTSHDWWALAYPPARRWECHRCGVIVEDAPSPLPDPSRVPRTGLKRENRQTPG